MKQIFHLTPPTDSSGIQPVLNIRAGEKHFSCVVTDKVTGELKELSYWIADEITSHNLAELIAHQPQFRGPFYQVNICYDYPGNFLVPAAGFRHEDASLMKSASPAYNAGSVTITELLAEWRLYNVYAAPGDIHELLTQRFSAARFWHESTVGLKNIHAAAGEGCMQADFRHHDFSLIAVRSGNLLLARNFEYSTPEDVIYCLLRTCRQFSLVQNEVRLELSGLIDKQSALYKDLYQYFSNMRFRENTWNLIDPEYPAHFFTSLNDLSVCVS